MVLGGFQAFRYERDVFFTDQRLPRDLRLHRGTKWQHVFLTDSVRQTYNYDVNNLMKRALNMLD